MSEYDAIVVGSGPNGFAAAITLAQAGLSVVMYEGKETIGGGMRSAELTEPGFVHDLCSTIQPLAVGSPFFASLPLDKHGLEWVFPEAALAHPFDEGSPALLEKSIANTAATLGADAEAYSRLMSPTVRNWDKLVDSLLGPFMLPRDPLAMLQFGYVAIRSAQSICHCRFSEERARSFFAGLAAHSILPLNKAATAAFGIILGALGHVIGWPMAKGGSQKIANALASYFKSLGGQIVTNHPIQSLDDLPPSRLIMCDIGPQQLLKIAGDRLPSGYKHRLESYQYGPGVFKIDWALNAPIPWKAKECLRAGTVHVAGTAEEIFLSESQVWKNEVPQKPFVLVAQQSLFDPTRAPAGKHTAWAYCHVPNGSSADMTSIIEAQIERFAPHFRDCIIARSTRSAIQMQEYNANYIGGDINGGAQDIWQLYTRPVARWNPYSTPVKGLYLCSSSTPPGGGVHGMCGYHAAKSAIS